MARVPGPFCYGHVLESDADRCPVCNPNPPVCPDCDGEASPLGNRDPEGLSRCGNCKGWF